MKTEFETLTRAKRYLVSKGYKLPHKYAAYYVSDDGSHRAWIIKVGWSQNARVYFSQLKLPLKERV